MRRIAGLLLPMLLLASCAREPEPAEPALWRISGPTGETGWLFGTIHSLPRPAKWRTPNVDAALSASDRIVVEVGNLADDTAMATVFTRLARSPGQVPLAQRVSPALREPLGRLLERGGMKPGDFGDTETWAAALTLARIGAPEVSGKYGIDRAVIAAAEHRPVVELEGADDQLGIFDRLPEAEQRDLLEAVVGDTGDLGESDRLAEVWRKGDMLAIEAETRSGILTDPELRQALFTDRNRAWTARIGAMLAAKGRPFVAVGAAHMAGPEGLPAMLEAQGYKVTRVQ